MKEHIEYEWWMLKQCYESLHHYTGFMFNVFHEAFCLHAYNLIMYYDAGYSDPEITRIMGMIKDQVLSLTSRRTGVFEEKIGPGNEREYIMIYLEPYYNEYEFKR